MKCFAGFLYLYVIWRAYECFVEIDARIIEPSLSIPMLMLKRKEVQLLHRKSTKFH